MFTLSNLVAKQAAYNLGAITASTGQSILRLSSGIRVQRPSDGAMEFMRGKSLESDIRVHQDIKNSLSEYKAVFSIASDAASEIRTKLQTMQEKAVAASDVTLTAGERSALFQEFDSLRTGINNLVRTTKYNGQGILDAAGTYNQALSITISPDRSTTMAVNLNNLDISTAGPGGLIIGNTAWANGAAATTSATQITTALNTVDTFLSQTGSAVNELESHIRVSESLIENYGAARSSLIETDLAAEMADYTALDVTKQAATAMLAQANLSHRTLLDLYKFNYS